MDSVLAKMEEYQKDQDKKIFGNGNTYKEVMRNLKSVKQTAAEKFMGKVSQMNYKVNKQLIEFEKNVF